MLALRERRVSKTPPSQRRRLGYVGGVGGQLEIVEYREEVGDEEGDAQRRDLDAKRGQSDSEVRVKKQHIEENSHDGADEGLEDNPESRRDALQDPEGRRTRLAKG
jgi:hypothetical protein